MIVAKYATLHPGRDGTALAPRERSERGEMIVAKKSCGSSETNKTIQPLHNVDYGKLREFDLDGSLNPHNL